MLYEPPQTKKYILVGVAALAILALVSWGVWKTKTTSVVALPSGIQKTNEEMRKESLNSLTAPEKPQGNQDEQIAPEALKNAKESLTAPETSSNSNNQTGGAPISQKVSDSLNTK